MAGVDAAIAKGFSTPTTCLSAGGSAGGVLTAWIVPHRPVPRGRVHAADGHQLGVVRRHLRRPALVQVVREVPVARCRRGSRSAPPSPTSRKVTTPTLLMTGEADLRTPIGQTEEFYRALKLLKKDTLLIRMPDEYHGWRRPSHQLLQQLYTLAWFDKYRIKKPAPTPH